jgi:hypothetical protein
MTQGSLLFVIVQTQARYTLLPCVAMIVPNENLKEGSPSVVPIIKVS